MVKHYVRHSLGEIKGPITIVTGKHRRVTFIECNNDINSMIDIAKVADLVSFALFYIYSRICIFFIVGITAHWRVLRIWNGDVRVSPYLSGTRNAANYGRTHSLGYDKEQRATEANEKDSQTSLLDRSVSGRTTVVYFSLWALNVILLKAIWLQFLKFIINLIYSWIFIKSLNRYATFMCPLRI